MPETPDIDIRPDHWRIVRDILRKHVSQYEVWAFGSRAKWTAKQYSDLDLAVITDKPLPLEVSASLADDFSESDLPWKVDVVDWAATSESFQKIIERDKVVVQKPVIASEWPVVRLGDVTTILGDGLHGTPEYDDSGDYYFVNGNNLKEGRISVDEKTRRVSHAEYEKHKKNLNERTILVSINGTLGNVALYGGEKVILGKSACYFNVKEGVNLYFVRYVMAGSPFQNYIHTLATGSTIKNVSLKLMRDFSFSLPPESAQKNIAETLKALDDRIDNLRQTNATLEAIAAALFKSWFVDFDGVAAEDMQESELGLIPKGWDIKPIGNLIERLSVGKKYEQKTVAETGNVPVLDQGKSGVIGYHNDVPGVMASVDKPVIVFANHTCYMRLVSFPFSAIQNVLPFVGKEIPTIWIYYATIGKQKFVEYKGHWPDFAITKICVPNLARCIEFSDLIHPMLKKQWENERHIATLAQLRDALLPRLISGKLRINSAECSEEVA